ncbi:MAG: hypothetical protein ACFCGT_18865 [Sandaracinaceae bacterium]
MASRSIGSSTPVHGLRARTAEGGSDGRDGRTFAYVALAALVAGCGSTAAPPDAGGSTDLGPADAGADLGPDLGDPGPPCEGPPGLYREGSCQILAEGVRFYEPRYALWSDGTEKQRFIYLPPGRQIDTSDADRWVFPEGTRLYKNFLEDGLLLETRVFTKMADEPGIIRWRVQVFAWNAAQDAVEEAGDVVRENVLGTAHDIPDFAMCVRCHSGARDAVNGFGAILLRHDRGGVTLATLREEGLLTNDIDPALAEPPGTFDEQTVLGYLHVNCGNCHVEGAEGGETGLLTVLPVGSLTVDATPFVQTAVGQASEWMPEIQRVMPGAPDDSAVLLRMVAPEPPERMPPIGSEVIDATAAQTVRAWIQGL